MSGYVYMFSRVFRSWKWKFLNISHKNFFNVILFKKHEDEDAINLYNSTEGYQIAEWILLKFITFVSLAMY